MALVVASAAPGARVVFVVVEVPAASPAPPGAPPLPTAPPGVPAVGPNVLPNDVPKPWTAPPGLDAQASAIAERREPFTTAELAAVLRCAPDTVSLWCRTGVLRGAVKPAGGSWRIPPAAVVALLAGSARQAPETTPAPSNSHAADDAGRPDAPSDVRLGVGGSSGGGAVGDADGDFDIASLGRWRHRRSGNGAPNGAPGGSAA